eukprot:594327-Pleurochrysis_carterae.AAC.1
MHAGKKGDKAVKEKNTEKGHLSEPRGRRTQHHARYRAQLRREHACQVLDHQRLRVDASACLLRNDGR